MIKIGFLGKTFFRHSCGYLLYWLVLGIKQTQRQDLTLEFYNLGIERSDSLASWFKEQGEFLECFGEPLGLLAKSIVEKEVDVLIDIDGVTSASNCLVVSSVKYFSQEVATISWMGFGPMGLCDYAIGDHQLIPQPEIYLEKVIRLPNCYISSGGFDVNKAEFTRADLKLPSEAIVFYFCQKQIKVNPPIIEAIKQILEQVPHGYLLLKVFSIETEKDEWLNLVPYGDRIRFLPISKLEENARANLSLVDVMLDSFPYNGTLTTLEALWMGVPVVSRYGQRWASRQGKTLLHQIGLPTFPDWQGYIDYAVQLGNNPELLAQTKQQIRDSKASSPLWNYQQHAKDFLSALESIL